MVVGKGRFWKGVVVVVEVWGGKEEVVIQYSINDGIIYIFWVNRGKGDTCKASRMSL